MNTILGYVRNLLGWVDETPGIRTSFKRDRADDDFPSDEDSPAIKRLKQLKRTSFPDIMSSNDLWPKKEKQKNVRYVPIQLESRPSTSTPNEHSPQSRLRSVPVKLVSVENNSFTPSRKPRLHTPVKPVIHAVIDDDDADDVEEVTILDNKSHNCKKPTRIYIEHDENDPQNDDEVIFVKKDTPPPPAKPYKFFLTKNIYDETDSKLEDPTYYRLQRISDRNSSSPKSKFKIPPGITKSYKKAPSSSVARWMQNPKSLNLSSVRNKYANPRSTLSDLFNLEEKKSYQELIKKASGTTKFASIGKPIDYINLAEESASFRNTQRAQKRALNEIKLVERGISTEKEGEASKEYDPVTVASINSSDSEVEIVPSESSSSSVKIDRVNSLKESLKDRDICSSDWLAKLNSRYRKKHQVTQEQLRDAKTESDIISKVNHEQKLALLENKLKYELSIDSLLEEAPAAVELPPLTPEQEKVVNKAIGPGPPGQVLVEKFNLRITRRDLQTLAGLNWLNDEVINFYMNLIMQRSEEKKDLPKTYATNTFFYPKLMQGGQAGLRRWTRKVDIFAHDLMVVPVHLGVHWCVSLVYIKDKKIHYLDSMGGRNNQCLEALMQYLKDEHQDKKGQPLDDKGWQKECLKDIPQQMNGSDCGVFSCTFAEFASRKAPFNFSQQHMPYLRRKAALEILRGKLLL